MPAFAVTVMFTVTTLPATGDAGEMVGVLMVGCAGAATVAIAGRSSKNERAKAILFDIGDKVFPTYHCDSENIPLL